MECWQTVGKMTLIAEHLPAAYLPLRKEKLMPLGITRRFVLLGYELGQR